MQKIEKDNTKKKSAKEKPELTHWHPAFCSATKLELVKNKKDLHYHSEYGLNTKPIQIDLLVIQKSKGVTIENDDLWLGRFVVKQAASWFYDFEHNNEQDLILEYYFYDKSHSLVSVLKNSSGNV